MVINSFIFFKLKHSYFTSIFESSAAYVMLFPFCAFKLLLHYFLACGKWKVHIDLALYVICVGNLYRSLLLCDLSFFFHYFKSIFIINFCNYTMVVNILNKYPGMQYLFSVQHFAMQWPADLVYFHLDLSTTVSLFYVADLKENQRVCSQTIWTYC